MPISMLMFMLNPPFVLANQANTHVYVGHPFALLIYRSAQLRSIDLRELFEAPKIRLFIIKSDQCLCVFFDDLSQNKPGNGVSWKL